jgi:uncharacterized phage-associated protein
MQTPQFNERKATQLAAAFIERSGGSLNHMKLIKLMYLADRTALLSWERPITGDDYFSLKHGPILSTTLSMISDEHNPSSENFWFDYIKKQGDYEVSLVKPCPPTDLSVAEVAVIDEVFSQYGHYDKWDLVKHLHEVLPEWNDPGPSSFPIYIRDILEGEGRSSQEIARVESDLDSLKMIDVLLGV